MCHPKKELSTPVENVVADENAKVEGPCAFAGLHRSIQCSIGCSIQCSIACSIGCSIGFSIECFMQCGVSTRLRLPTTASIVPPIGHRARSHRRPRGVYVNSTCMPACAGASECLHGARESIPTLVEFHFESHSFHTFHTQALHHWCNQGAP